jgi:hypothetical protein
VCDSPMPTDGRTDPFVIVSESDSPNPLGGQTGGAPPMSCGECCAWAWDLCFDQFLIELGLTGSAAEAALECYQRCLGGANRLGACMSDCLLAKQVGRQGRIVRAVERFLKCLGGLSAGCSKERGEDCVCPWM